jgi:hypothetical protein
MPDARCSGDYGIHSACAYHDVLFILSGAGTLGSGHAEFIRDQLTRASSKWRVCAWHKNQSAMQVGAKPDEVGWEPYEECRAGGAIIATAHEHSYSRTSTLRDLSEQALDPEWLDPNELRVGGGSTFVFVAGLGGHSIRGQKRCRPVATVPSCQGEWASIYTQDQGASFGALFIDFHTDNDPSRARGYFKNIRGEIVDEFSIVSFNP